jgi:hypothetical protein
MNERDLNTKLIFAVAQLLFMVISIGFIIHMFSGGKHLGEELVKEKVKIYSVDTQKGLNGTFALGCGGVDTRVNYYVYEDKGDKGKILQDFNAKETFIKDELNQEDDSYVEMEYKVSYDVPSHIEALYRGAIDGSDTTVKYKGEDCFTRNTMISNTLYIPKGYIKKQIDLNIK